MRALRFFRPRHLKRLRVSAIVSTGRTGTQFLAHVLNRPELGIISKHEPPPALGELGNEFVKGRKSLDETASAVMTDRSEIFSGINDDLYVESNPALTFLLPALADVLKQFKVIHVVRNPIDFVCSGVNRVQQRDGQTIQTYAGDENWHLRSSDFADSKEDWAALDIYERFMWTWSFKNAFARNFILENPSRGLIVRFEDIFHSESRGGFRAILKFLGLDKLGSSFDHREFTQVMNASKASLAQPFQDWPARRKASLERICGNLAGVWNYGLSPV